MKIYEDPRKAITPDLTYQVSEVKKVVKHLDIDGSTYIEYNYKDISVYMPELMMSKLDMHLSAEYREAIISNIKICEEPEGRKLHMRCEKIARNVVKVDLDITPPLRKGDDPISVGISYIITTGTCMFIEDFPNFYPGDSSNLEDTSVTTQRSCGELIIIVNFLPNYPVAPRGKFSLVGHEFELGPNEFKYDRDTDSARLGVVGPRVAAGKYVVQWTPPKREQLGRR